MTPPRPVGLMLCDGFDFALLGRLVEALRQNRHAARLREGWRILTPDGGPVRADNGIAVQPDPGPRTAEGYACLILIGWNGAGDGNGDGPWPAARAKDSVPVLLAEPGTITQLIDRLLRRSDDALQEADPAAPAPSAAIAAARDPLVVITLRKMRQNLETARRIADLIRDLDVGRRMLERRFRADIGLSPQEAYATLRLERAIELLRMTEDSLSEIALSCGFCDASHLVRAMKGKLNTTPGEIRRAPR